MKSEAKDKYPRLDSQLIELKRYVHALKQKYSVTDHINTKRSLTEIDDSQSYNSVDESDLKTMFDQVDKMNEHMMKQFGMK